MTSDPKLSIITPSYDDAEFLRDNLESVAEQADGDVEHIVVDGGSEDGTVELLTKYEDRYELRWVSEPDRGQSHAINKGLRMANGEWIGWQNSDDYYIQGAFDALKRTERQHPDANIVYGDVLKVNENGDEIQRLFMTKPSMFMHRHWSMFARNQSAFFRASVFDEIGTIDEDLDFALDADIFARALEADLKMVHVPEFLGAFRYHLDAKTHGEFSASQQREWEEIHDRSIVERRMPSAVLATVGKAIKAVNLARDRRWEAFRYRKPNSGS